MKFKTADLRRAVADAINRLEVQFDNETAELVDAYEQRLSSWNEEYAEQWADAAKAITRKIRRGHPILQLDLPGRHGAATFDVRAPKPRTFTPPSGLSQLAILLELVADPEVTTAGLQGLGITSATMRVAIAQLPAGSVNN